MTTTGKRGISAAPFVVGGAGGFRVGVFRGRVETGTIEIKQEMNKRDCRAVPQIPAMRLQPKHYPRNEIIAILLTTKAGFILYYPQGNEEYRRCCICCFTQLVCYGILIDLPLNGSSAIFFGGESHW